MATELSRMPDDMIVTCFKACCDIYLEKLKGIIPK